MKNNISKLTCATLMFFSCFSKLQAQVSSYTYAQSNSAYTAISGGTTYGGTSEDDGTFNAINIGFTFKYNCIDFTQISLSPNGFIALGSNVSSSYNPISSGSSNNVISASGHDMQGNSTNSEMRVELIGASPNRVLVIQWKKYKSYSGTIDDYNFQVRLSETSNLIELHYNAFVKDATNKTVEIGLRGSSNADFKNLSCVGAWTTAVSGGANTATVDLRTARVPANGQKYTFTPPATAMTYSSSNIVDEALAANVDKCATNVLMSRVEIVSTGSCGSPLSLTQLLLNMTGTAATSTVSKVHVYYTGTSSSFSAINEFVAGGLNPAASLTFNSTQILSLGTNYFWIAYDLNGTGTNGNTIGADMPASSLTVGGTARTPSATPNCLKTYIVCSPGPGGIIGSSLWLKSNASTNTSTNGALISSWASQSSPAVTVTQATAALQPTYKDGSGTGTNNRFNYNPFIYTDGTSNRLIQTGDINLGNTTAGFSVYQVIGEDNGIVAMDWYHTSNGNIKVKGDALMYINKADGSSQENTFSSNGSQTVEAFLQSVRGVPGAISGNGKFNGVSGASYNNGWRVATQNGICIGSNLDNGEFMQGGMGEFIIFPSILSVTSNLQVESYLAIKYGITLGTSAAVSNYLSSNGTQIWTGNATYQNKIIGIGRDDNSVLLQKQSHNYDDTVRIYKGTLSTTNVGNAATFAVDKSFVISGANTGKMCATATSNAEIPTGLTSCALTSRMEREWRITKTNFAENFNMDFKLNTCGAPGSVAVADLRFLVDDDGNFANGGTQCYYNGDGSGIVISYSNPTITISNISNTHIANNVTKFVTIASINPATPLPIELLFFDAKLNNKKTVDLTWETAAERDNDYFTVDKSVDGIIWNYLGTVDGAGTTSLAQNYYLEDQNPFYGINYYRLKQTDFNGQYSFADIKTVELKQENLYFSYPNPANSSINICGENISSLNIEIYDNLGKMVQLNKKTISINQIEIQTDQLANGLYYIKISDTTLINVQKLLIKH